tara:strand:+ start:1463 stop:2296 length:834 start_codon:yes stop_codon:yes gene_type:complete
MKSLRFYGLTNDGVKQNQVAMRQIHCDDHEVVQVLTFDGEVIKGKLESKILHKDGQTVVRDGQRITLKPCRKVFTLEKYLKRGVMTAFPPDYKISDLKVYDWSVREVKESDFQIFSKPEKLIGKELDFSFAINGKKQIVIGKSDYVQSVKTSNYFEKEKLPFSFYCRVWENPRVKKILCSSPSPDGDPVFIDYYFVSYGNEVAFAGKSEGVLWSNGAYFGPVSNTLVNGVNVELVVMPSLGFKLLDIRSQTFSTEDQFLTDHLFYIPNLLYLPKQSE